MKWSVAGARGEVDSVARLLQAAREVSEEWRCEITLVNPALVFGPRHIESAVTHALRAFKQHENTSESLSGEILCYVCAERQVSSALKKAGIKKGDKALIVVACGDEPEAACAGLLATTGFQRDDRVLSEEGKDAAYILGVMGLTIPAGLEGRGLEVILEKVALLDIMK